MIHALYPGSFDPVSYGHLNIIERGVTIFDQIDVVISVNVQKEYLFSAEERTTMMEELLGKYKNIRVHVWDKIIVDFADKIGAKVIIRGVRALSDFSHEFELAMLNSGLNSSIETFFIPTDPKYFVLRSSTIKELTMFGGDVSSMVPPNVEKALKAKLLQS